MNKTVSRLFQHIGIWLRNSVSLLTEPAQQIKNVEQRYQARLLASMLVVVIPTVAVITILPVVLGVGSVYSDLTAIVGLLAIAFLLIAYVLSRSRHSYFGARMGFLIGVVSITVATLINPYPSTLTYLIAVVLLSSLLFSARTTFLFTLAGLAWMAALAILLPYNYPFRDTNLYISSYIVLSVLILSMNYNIRLLEQERRDEIAAREVRLNMMLMQMPAILWTTDRDLRVTSITGGDVYEMTLSPQQLIGRPFHKPDEADDTNASRRDAHQLALQGKSSTFDWIQGDAVFQCHVEPLYDTEGAISGCIGVALDVSHRKEAEQRELELAREREHVRILSEFLQNASHDLRTPLSTLHISAHLAERTRSEERRQHHLKVIQANIGHLNQLVENLLIMSRLDSGREFNRAPLQINRLMQDIVTHYTPDAEEKSIVLRHELDKTLPQINGDEVELMRAFCNLVENALQHTPENGTITLRTYRKALNVMVEIEDTGTGISEEHLNHIFERFYRVDQARSQQSGGNGLGLPIARKIIEGHDGEISVKSRLDEGTTFIIALRLQNGSPHKNAPAQPFSIPS